MTDELTRSSTRVLGFDDPELDFQLLRQLGSVACGGASVGEVLAAADAVRRRGPASWSEVFAELADHQRADAEGRARAGNGVSARDQFLRACNSYRAAEYFTPVDTERRRQWGHASRNAFGSAMTLFDFSFQQLRIEVDGHGLPGYWFSPPGVDAPGPALLATSGFDGTLEETFLQVGRAALERGWRVLLVAGPGQTDTVRDDPDSCFVPDTERWLSPWTDIALRSPEVDPRRTALLGISFGGYFVLRAVAADDRIPAVVANSPIVDLRAYLVSFAGMDPETDMDAEDDFGLDDIDGMTDEQLPPPVKELSRGLIRRFGQPGFRATFEHLKDFRVAPSEVRCPSLALVGDGEGAEPRAQFERFAAEAGGPVTARVFTALEGADSHCQVANPALSNAVLLDWLASLT